MPFDEAEDVRWKVTARSSYTTNCGEIPSGYLLQVPSNQTYKQASKKSLNGNKARS